jgi:hypothetical protein
MASYAHKGEHQSRVKNSTRRRGGLVMLRVTLWHLVKHMTRISNHVSLQAHFAFHLTRPSRICCPLSLARLLLISRCSEFYDIQ